MTAGINLCFLLLAGRDFGVSVKTPEHSYRKYNMVAMSSALLNSHVYRCAL